MKRKPLQLKAETVRVLASNELSAVNGGYAAKATATSNYCNNGGGQPAVGTGSVTSEYGGIERQFEGR